MGRVISSQADWKGCSKCKRQLPLVNFVFRQSKSRYSSRCKECISKQNKAYYSRNRDQVKASARKYYWENREKIREYDNWYHKERHRKLKAQVVEHYGGKCACCGEEEILFLSVDHIDENGAEMRKSGSHPTGTQFFQWLVRQGYPLDFQILCYNCNIAKHRNGGICPHQSEGSETSPEGRRIKRSEARNTLLG